MNKYYKNIAKISIKYYNRLMNIKLPAPKKPHKVTQGIYAKVEESLFENANRLRKAKGYTWEQVVESALLAFIEECKKQRK